MQNDCGLSQRQLPAAVRAVEKSKLKTEVQVLFMQQVKAAIYGGTHAKSMNAGSGGNRDRSNSSSKADPSAKVTSADRDAACFAVGAKEVSFYLFFGLLTIFSTILLFYFIFCNSSLFKLTQIQANNGVNRELKHAFKMAIKNAMTMADIFLLLHCILTKDCTQTDMLETLANSSMESRGVQEQKSMAQNVLENETTLIANAKSKKAAVATVQTNACNTSKLLVAVLQAAIAGKLAKEIQESLASVSDGDKIALLTIINSCKQSKDKSKKEMIAAAKTAAMQAKSYGEQAIVIEMILRNKDARGLKKSANKAAVDGTRQQVLVDEEQKERIQTLINSLSDTEESPINENHCMVMTDALPDIQEGSQLVKLLGALLLAVKPTIIRTMAESWIPKDEFGRPIKRHRLEGLTPKQRTKGMDIIKGLSWLAASDKGVALTIASGCKHQMTMLMLFLHILDGKPARVLKRLGKSIQNMDDTVIPQEDVVTPKFRKEILAIVERSKNVPTGAKRSGALRAVKKKERSSNMLAVVTALMEGKSVYQIVGAHALGADAQVDDATKQQMLEEENKKKKQGDEEYEQKYGCLLHSTVHNEQQKASGLVALKKARTSPFRCEVLLQLLTRSTPEEILNSVNKRGVNKTFSKEEKKIVAASIQASDLWNDHKVLATKLIMNASTKQELVIILEKSVGWLEHITEDDKQKYTNAIDKCPHFGSEEEAQGKKLYMLQWLEQIQTKMQLFVLQLVTLEWQANGVHWMNQAYERIFNTPLPEPLASATIEMTKGAIKKCKHKKAKCKATRETLSKVQEQQHIVELLNTLIGDGKPKELKCAFPLPPVGWVPVPRETLIQKYAGGKFSLTSGNAGKMNANQKFQQNKNKQLQLQLKKDREAEAMERGGGNIGNVDTRSLDEEIDHFLQTMEFDETITKRQKYALKKALQEENCTTMEEFDHYVRISKLLSSAKGVDNAAKTERPSPVFIACCASVIRFDPRATDMVVNGAEEMLLNVKNPTVLKLVGVVRGTTTEKYSSYGGGGGGGGGGEVISVLKFKWNKPGVSTSKVDEEDMRNIVAYIRSVSGLLPEERMAAKEGTLIYELRAWSGVFWLIFFF